MQYPYLYNYELIKSGSVPIICFPYAGGSSRIFNSWKRFLDSSLQLIPLELKGRARRVNEKYYSGLNELFEELLFFFKHYVSGEFILFGHSMGALISFELTHLLSQIGLTPKLLVVSACLSPNQRNTDRRQPKSTLSDLGLIETLKNLNGIPPEILQSKEFMEFYIPIIRNDFKLLEHLDKRLRIKPHRVACPILTIGGDLDLEVPFEMISDWKEYTTSSFHTYKLEGDHFFIHNYPQDITLKIKQTLSQLSENSVRDSK